ncbi:MAG: hypothetical protein IJ086_00400 [Clostridium sp.]|nr:hypothetical protein [Clostridium sp.]
MRLDSLIGRLVDLLEEGVSKEIKVGYKYNGEIKYIAPASCDDKGECRLVYFSSGVYESEKSEEDDLDNFLDNIIANCNRCSHGNTDCERYSCHLKITPMVNCSIDKDIKPVYDIDNIEYDKSRNIVMLELSNEMETIKAL